MTITPQTYIFEIKGILRAAQAKTYTAINSAMVEAYWLVGKRIVEEEQQGKERAEYGRQIIKTLSKELRAEFGAGFSERTLRNFRQFYMIFKDSEFGTHCVPNLSWSHFRLLMRLTDKSAIRYYLAEAESNNWSVRTLDRNISTLYYQRLLSSQKKDIVIAEMESKTAEFHIDLVFYNFILECFVVIELKTAKITHQDIGQLDMYVRMFDDMEKREGDNPTIGILLCTETDKTIAKYSVLSESKQLFAAKYLPYLPTEEELVAEIERQKEILKIQVSEKHP